MHNNKPILLHGATHAVGRPPCRLQLTHRFKVFRLDLDLNCFVYSLFEYEIEEFVQDCDPLLPTHLLYNDQQLSRQCKGCQKVRAQSQQQTTYSVKANRRRQNLHTGSL